MYVLVPLMSAGGTKTASTQETCKTIFGGAIGVRRVAGGEHGRAGTGHAWGIGLFRHQCDSQYPVDQYGSTGYCLRRKDCCGSSATKPLDGYAFNTLKGRHRSHLPPKTALQSVLPPIQRLQHHSLQGPKWGFGPQKTWFWGRFWHFPKTSQMIPKGI